ncbi:GNAT family N-acetyltransferase [Novosphingobium sp.]|uniref:GNAT family N-acetyltransferase n=1 Tax=Novosphingobium sp. TaxID=1874826 RepID=UPI0025CD3EF7|nr:GNAT family N-acetyltransferase [Novosphingobium sp.]
MQASRPTFRRARAADVAKIVTLLADDMLGDAREATADAEAQLAYLAAFGEIDADPNQLLAVAEMNGEIVGTLQLTFIAGLSRQGSKRGIIEAVRVASQHRGKKIGGAMIAWAIEHCRERRCRLVQLTTDNARVDAHRFYDRLGFEASHIGYKFAL